MSRSNRDPGSVPVRVTPPSSLVSFLCEDAEKVQTDSEAGGELLPTSSRCTWFLRWLKLLGGSPGPAPPPAPGWVESDGDRWVIRSVLRPHVTCSGRMSPGRRCAATLTVPRGAELLFRAAPLLPASF